MSKKGSIIGIFLIFFLLFMFNLNLQAEDTDNVVLYNFTRFYEYTGQEIKPTDLVLTYNGETLVEATYDENEGKYIGDYVVTYPADCTSVGRKEVTIELVDEDETYVFSGEERIDTFYYYICDKLIQLWEYGISDGMSAELPGGTAAPFANLGQDYADYISITDDTASSVGEYTTVIKNKNDKYVIIEYKDQYNSSYYMELKTSDDHLDINWDAKRAIFTENDERVEVTGLENMGYTIGSNFTLSWDGNVNFGDTLTRGTDYEVYFYIPQLFEADEDVTTLFASDADGTVYDVILRIVFDGNYGGYVDKTIKLCPSIEGATVEALEGATMISDIIQFQYGLKTPPFNLKMTIKGEEKTLVYGTDFDVHSSYLFGSVNSASPLTLEAEGIGDYAGICNISYSLTAKSLNDESMTYNADSNAHYIGEDTQLNIQIYDTNYSDIYTIDSINYDVSYEFDTDNNIGIATITGRENYKDSFDVEFHLANRAWGDSELTWDLKWDIEYKDYDALFYSATPKYPTLVIRYDGELLTEGTDYDLSVSNWNLNELLNLNITFKGNYYGVAAFPFFIVPVIIEGIEPYVVKNGAEATLDLIIKNKNNEVLTLNDDYEITYSNNTEFGIATFTIALDSENIITGESVSGNIVGTFNVAGTVLTEDDFEIEGLDNGDYSITMGQTYVPNPTITYNGAELTKDTDYKIVTVVKDSAGNIHTNGSESGISNSDADGSVYYATTTIEFIDQYYGTFTYNTLIVPRIDSATIVPKDDARTEISYLYYTYTGSNIVPDFELELEIKGVLTTLTLGTDFEIADLPDEMKNVGGDYYFYINGINNFGGSIYVMVDIEALDSSYVDVECDGYALYTGEPVTPNIVLTDSNDNVLVEGTDYEITYSDNTALGEASYDISFMGNYGGDPKNGTFRIVTRVITQDDLTSGDLVIDDVLTENVPYYIGVPNTHNNSGTRTGKYKGTDIELEVTTMVLDSNGNPHFDNNSNPGLQNSDADGTIYTILYTYTASGDLFGSVTTTRKYCPDIETSTITYSGNHSFRYDSPTYLYTGEEIIPTIAKLTLSIGGSDVELVEGVDFEIEKGSANYTEATPDLKEMLIKGIGNYAGSKYLHFYIAQYDLTEATFITNPYYIEEPQVIVVYEGKILEASNYSVSPYESLWRITGLGLYSGQYTFEANMTAVGISLDDSDVAISISSNDRAYASGTIEEGTVKYLFSGEEIEPEFSVEYVGIDNNHAGLMVNYDTYVFNSDKVTMFGTTEVSDKKMLIILAGKDEYYTGYKIIEANVLLNELDTSGLTFEYTGTQITFEDIDNPDIAGISTSVPIIDAGTYNVTVKGANGYGFKVEDEYVLEAVVEITVTPYHISDAENIEFTLDKDSYGAYLDEREIEPLITSMSLTGDVEYEFSSDEFSISGYSANTTAGTGRIFVTLASGNIALADGVDSLILTFTILDKNIEDYIISNCLDYDYRDEETVIYYLYTGEVITPTISTDLVLNTDYKVTYSNTAEEAGYVVVTGLGSYGGETTIDYVITPNILLSSNTEIVFTSPIAGYDNPSYLFTGEAIEPAVTVKFNGEVLDPENYTVIYGDNIERGFVGITGKNGYLGEIEESFDILNNNIEDADIELSGFDDFIDEVYIYLFDGSNPEIIVGRFIFNGNEYSDSSYEIEDYDITNPGEYVIKIKGVNDFLGTKEIACKTEANILDNLYVEYTGSAITAAELIEANELSDAVDSVLEITNATDAGTYDVKLRLNKGFALYINQEYYNEAETTFEIIAKLLSVDDATVTTEDEFYYYTGQEIKPSFTVKIGDVLLENNKDYEVTYSDNINVGTGYINLEFKGNYASDGAYDYEFNIFYDILNGDLAIEGFDSLEDSTYIYLYDGTNPTVKVLDPDGNEFSECEIEEYDVKNPGEYVIKINGIDSYRGTIEITCKTTVEVIENLKIEFANKEILGSALIEANSLTDKANIVSIDDAFNVGTYNVTLELNRGYALYQNEEYKTSGETSFEVYAKELTKDDLAITLEEFYIYSSEALTPEFTLKYGEIEFALDEDFEVAYSDNDKAGNGTISITLINNYSNANSIEYEFVIKYSLEEAEIVLNGLDEYLEEEGLYIYQFDGKNPTITATVKYNGEEVADSYEIVEYDITAPADYVIRVSGLGDFEGVMSFDVRTDAVLVEDIYIEYTGEVITADELIEANELTNAIAEVLEIDEAKAAGTYNIKLKLNKGYALFDEDEYFAEGVTTFDVLAKFLSVDDATVTTEDEFYYYTGEEIKPSFTVKIGDVLLEENKDYEVEYSDNINVGTGYINLSFIGNYQSDGPYSYEFSIYYDILKAALAIEGFDSLEDGTYIYLYDGTNPTIKALNPDGNEFIECEIEEYDVKNPGEYVIKINGIESYRGAKEITCKTTVEVIKNLKIEFANKNISEDDLLEANDLSNKARITNTFNNVFNVGTYSVSLELNRGYALYQNEEYKTSGETSFEVYAKELTKEDLSCEYETIYYATGSAIEPSVSIYNEEVELIENKDFVVTYSNNIIPGTATIEVTLKGNYKNAEVIEYAFEIKAKTMYDIETTYTGKTIYMMDVLVDYGLDEAIAKIKNGDYSAKNAGTYTCYIVLKDGFSFDEEGLITEGDYSWTILPVEINLEDVVVEISKQAYTGSAIIPAIIISYDGRDIRPEDYDLTLENNVEVGIATATIKVKNNFVNDGEIIKEFEIFDPDAPFKAYRTRVINSLKSYLTDDVAANLATNIGKLATAEDIKSLYLATMPTILANRLLAMGGYITSIKDITETDREGLEEILEHYKELEKYVSANKYISTINTVLEEDLLTDEALANDIKNVLDLLVTDLGYSKFESFVEDLINASIIEKEKSEALDSVQKTIRTHDKVSVLSVMEHQKEELKAQEYIVQTDDNTRNNYLESFKDEVYRQRVLYQIQLQHQIAQSRSINSVTDVYNNLLNEHDYNEIELLKLKQILDEYILSINELEMAQTEDNEVLLIYQMAHMAEDAIYDLYDVGVANIVSDEVIISSSTGINKDAVVKIEVNKNISSADIINAKNNGIISNINKTDEELVELVSNKEILRVMDISIVAKDEVVNEFDGIYTVKIPLDNELKNVNNPVVVFINADGTLEVLDTYIEGEFLVFKTTHFSNYAVIGNKIVDLGWLLILLLTTFIVEVFIVIYLVKLTKPFKSKKALGLLTILPTGFVGYLVTLIILNIIGIAAIIYLIVRFNKSCDKEVDKNE